MIKKMILSSLVAGVMFINNAYANNLDEYELLSSQAGLGIYKKDGSYGIGEIYVQRINMKHVDVKLMHGNKSGDFFGKATLSSYWTILKDNINALSVSNGAFFEDLSNTSTQLSFPIKINGNTLTTGASNDFPNERKMLVFKDTCANGYKCALVMNYSTSILNSSSYSNIIVGLSPYADKSSSFPLGRTFIGVDHSNTGTPILYIVHGTNATQSQMREVMYDLNIYDDAIVMLDGSGSSQLAFGNTKVYGSRGTGPDYRKIPQVIVVIKK